MFPSHHRITQRTVMHLNLFLPFILLLAACSGTGASHSASSSPPATLSTSTSPQSTLAAKLKTYTGTNFSLSYPQGWQAQGSGNQVIFQDAQGLNALTVIITPNPGSLKSASTLADTTFPPVEKAILTNPQPTSLAPTTTVAGENWAQRGATGTLSTGGQSMPGTLTLLIDNHPASSSKTLAYEIYYGGPTATFEQMNHTAFQAMLQSFKFTA